MSFLGFLERKIDETSRETDMHSEYYVRSKRLDSNRTRCERPERGKFRREVWGTGARLLHILLLAANGTSP